MLRKDTSHTLFGIYGLIDVLVLLFTYLMAVKKRGLDARNKKKQFNNDVMKIIKRGTKTGKVKSKTEAKLPGGTE